MIQVEENYEECRSPSPVPQTEMNAPSGRYLEMLEKEAQEKASLKLALQLQAEEDAMTAANYEEDPAQDERPANYAERQFEFEEKTENLLPSAKRPLLPDNFPPPKRKVLNSKEAEAMPIWKFKCTAKMLDARFGKDEIVQSILEFCVKYSKMR